MHVHLGTHNLKDTTHKKLNEQFMDADGEISYVDIV